MKTLRATSIRRLTFLSTAFFAMSLSVAAHAADPPDGSYRKTCVPANFTGSVLTAHCQPENGPNFRTSQIEVHACGRDDIFNRDGGLQCFAPQGWGSGRAVPRGSYIDTCKNVIVTNDQKSISAQCKDGDGNYRGTQFTTAGCQSGALDNNNGNLVCHR
jgi:hypothetical protein